MRTVTAASVAVLTAGLVFFGLGIRGRSGAGVQAPPVNGAAVQAQALPGGVALHDAGWQAAPAQPATLVTCGPGAQTLVRTAWLNGQQVSQIDCLAAASGPMAVPQALPVAAQAPVYDAQMTRARTYQPAPVRRTVARPHRSWKKTALVIGGTTAAGAGIGGLIGGKKGALIGAAVGGGASTLYEAVKR